MARRIGLAAVAALMLLQARALEGAGGPGFHEFVAEERRRSPEYGGRTVMDDAPNAYLRAKMRI